jgi:TolB-like protein
MIRRRMRFEQVRQRKLVQWTLAYLAVAWLLYQVLAAVTDAFGWSKLIEQSALVILGMGLIAVLVLAWYHGEQGRQRASGVELLILTVLCLIAGGAVMALARAQGDAAESEVQAVTAPPGSVAVLPFANHSAAADDAYFAAGIHDELLTQLSKMSALKVIGRTSVMQYAQTTKSAREIAGELGVAAILQGSVQRVGTRVRVRAQLVDAASDTQLWGDNYDREMADIFTIQTDVAIAIATALRANLTPREQATVAQEPTRSTEAYDLYLQAREYGTRPTRRIEDYLAAVALYERALQLDPAFALAYAALADVHGWIFWDGHDRSRARGEQMRVAAERALELQPNLVEAHVAMGTYYYRVLRDYDRALVELDIALQDAPGDADAIMTVGAVKRRKGEFAEAAREMERAESLDPRNANIPYEIGSTYLMLRDYPRGARAYNRAFRILPDYGFARYRNALLHIAWTGNTDSLAVVAQSPALNTPAEVWTVLDAARMLRDTALARRAADGADDMFRTQYGVLPKDLARAWALEIRGDSVAALAAFIRARVIIEDAIRRGARDDRHYLTYAYILAGMRLRAETRDAIHHVRRVRPPDAFADRQIMAYAAEIFARAGDADAAIAELQALFSGPGFLSAHNLRIDPVWDPIRNDPRFAELIRR